MPRPSMAFYRGGGQGNLWLVKRSPAGVRMSAQAKHISAPHFDVFDGWFRQASFEGCSFIDALLEAKANGPVRRAAIVHLAKIRALVQDLAQEANLQEPQKFAQVWHMLMKGSIVSACEGNRNAAREAKFAARMVMRNWPVR